MGFQGLIFGESIKIDNHHSGADISLHDRGLHLHKRQNPKSRKRGAVEARIPFDGSITFEDCWGEYSGKMRREIQKAFGNQQRRQEFFDYIWEVLVTIGSPNGTNHSSGKQTAGDSYAISSTLRDQIIEKLRNVVPYFGMDPNDLKDEHYLPSRGVRASGGASGSALILDYEKSNPTSRWEVNRHLYVKLSFQDPSIVFSSAKYVVEKSWEDQ